VKQKIGGKNKEYKNRRENERNKEHDKIIQYFPQCFLKYTINKNNFTVEEFLEVMKK
jgi:hypothetical protein